MSRNDAISVTLEVAYRSNPLLTLRNAKGSTAVFLSSHMTVFYFEALNASLPLRRCILFDHPWADYNESTNLCTKTSPLVASSPRQRPYGLNVGLRFLFEADPNENVAISLHSRRDRIWVIGSVPAHIYVWACARSKNHWQSTLPPLSSQILFSSSLTTWQISREASGSRY